MTDTAKKKKQAVSQYGYNADGTPRRSIPVGLLPNLNYKSVSPGEKGWLTPAEAQARLNTIHPSIIIGSPTVITNWCREQGVKSISVGKRVWIHEKNIKIIGDTLLGTLLLEPPASALIPYGPKQEDPEVVNAEIVTVPEHVSLEEKVDKLFELVIHLSAVSDQHEAMIRQMRSEIGKRQFSQRTIWEEVKEGTNND